MSTTVPSDAHRRLEQLERLLDSTPDGIFVIGPDRQLKFFNRACGEITGRNPADILQSGCRCNEVIECHTAEGESLAVGTLCPARAVFTGEVASQREEMLLTNHAGEERWVETAYSPVLGDDGRVEYVIGVLRDVHERKQLEERLHQSEKLASLGQLVAGIAHEIKNPLGIILSSLDVIESPHRTPEQRAEAAQFIREEVRRLDARLRAFLAFARPRHPEFRPVVLTGLIRRRIDSVRALFPRIDFQIDAPAPEPILMADEELLNQVLTNLVLNAGEALDGTGTIVVRARQSGEWAILEVEDSGPGVPTEHEARIFDPFFTTKAGGTGLGLSVCYQIVLAHRGTMSVSRSRRLGGACFQIRLPQRTGAE
jgi:PAS domain S-box-containing protein